MTLIGNILFFIFGGFVIFFGYLLGGTVGIGTMVFAFGIGPLVGVILPRLTIDPSPAEQLDRSDLGEAH